MSSGMGFDDLGNTKPGRPRYSDWSESHNLIVMSLVPYAGAIAPRATLYGYRSAVAARKIQSAWRTALARKTLRYGPPTMRFAKRRARAMYRVAKRRKIFKPDNSYAGSATTKRVVIQQDATGQLRADRTIFTTDLGAIPHNANNQINSRQRNLVNLRGTKICMEVANNVSAPLYFNIAVVVPKLDTTVSATNFFRASGSERGSDFDATSLTGLQFHCLPINSDKYRILYHKRYKLIGADNVTRVARQGKDYMTIMKYIKFKRQLRFDNTSTTTSEGGSPHMVYWASQFDSAATAGSTADVYTVTERFVSYFREPKS